MEREKCQNGNLELDVDYDGECINDDDEIEFEAIEADEEGHSEDPGCSGQIRLICKPRNNFLVSSYNRLNLENAPKCSILLISFHFKLGENHTCKWGVKAMTRSPAKWLNPSVWLSRF